MPNGRIRVMIVEDSPFMRRILHEIISAHPQLEVVGQARDGREGFALAASLQPDVITMDINMPHMDGLQATELIMAKNPRPIVIVSSESREGAASTLRALELGAIDFVSKPTGGVDLDMNLVREDLCRKLCMAAKVRVVRTAVRAKGASPSSGAQKSSSQGPSSPAGDRFPIVVVAASTGGPATAMRLFPSFPKDFPGAVCLVLHMPANFTSQFSLQLADVCAMRVKEAAQNESVVPGTLYVCPGSHHLAISSTGSVRLNAGERIGGYRPCADVTLESVAAYAGAMTIGVVLTGMGNDASRGIQAVKRAGGYVIAQDEASSVIFGMPAEAIKTGAVDSVLGLDQIYAAVERRMAPWIRPAPAGVR